MITHVGHLKTLTPEADKNQRRIARSDGVNASIKPCREKIRSAYFINAAADLGTSIE